jgi:hypothetical protein
MNATEQSKETIVFPKIEHFDQISIYNTSAKIT